MLYSFTFTINGRLKGKKWYNKFGNGTLYVEVSSFIKNTWKLFSMKMRRAPH